MPCVLPIYVQGSVVEQDCRCRALERYAFLTSRPLYPILAISDIFQDQRRSSALSRHAGCRHVCGANASTRSAEMSEPSFIAAKPPIE